MEGKPENEGRRGEERERERSREDGDTASGITLFDAIQEITKYNANAPLDNNRQLELYLKSWWSKIYNRPLKDPLLQSYTLEELLYEFYDRVERKQAEEKNSGELNDRIDGERFKENLDWAEEEELKEIEALKKKQEEERKLQEAIEDKAIDPLDDEDAKWMKDQVQKEIEEGKKLYGDDFGEDIEEEF